MKRRVTTVALAFAAVALIYLLTADATATYVCVNKGGANPSAQSKTTVAGPVSAEGTFNSGKNGNVTVSLGTFPSGCLLPEVRGACE